MILEPPCVCRSADLTFVVPLQVFEDGQPIKANPLAWWEFKDCMEYLERSGLERHPLHDQASTFLINFYYCYRGGNNP